MTGVSPAHGNGPSTLFLPAAEAGLIALTVATVLGFWRVFDSLDFLPAMVAVALVAHVTMAFGRRRGWGVPTTALISLPGVALACVWLVFPDSTISGVPTAATLTAVSDALTDSWHQFSTILAPASPEPGFVVASCVALYFAVFLADWAAFRLWSSFEAVVPATTLFLFCALLAAQRRVVSAGLFLAALLLFLLLHRLARQESSSGWLMGEAARPAENGAPGFGRRSGPVVAGAGLVAVAVLAGTLLGTRVPGAGSPGVWGWRNNGQGAGERKEVSPLVHIRDRLLNQPDTPLFTVEANQPFYWRMTALDMFDGDIWRSQAKYTEADGDLPGDVGDGTAAELRQRFTIQNLANIWAPAAYRPKQVVERSIGLSFNEESSTLIVDNNDSLPGATYEVVSRFARPTVENLRSVTTDDIPKNIREHYIELPDGFSQTARQTARDVVGNRTRPYEMARALQDYFRSGLFTYDTDFRLGHNDSAIDVFLEKKRGFCEQFAGTYAAMARSLGLPARVAVGFTPGDNPDPQRKNFFQVTGRFTHAWPEVYLGRYGWVMFEPTPNRGAQFAEEWTDVPAHQASRTDDAAAPTSAVAPGTTPTTLFGPQPPTTPEPETTTTLPEPAPPRTETVSTPWRWVLIVVPSVIAGLLVFAAGVALAGYFYISVLAGMRDRRRRDRRAWATDPGRRVVVAWEECLDALAVIGFEPRTTESHDEFAARVAPRLGDAGPDLMALAAAMDQAEFARDLLGDDVATTAVAAAATVEDAAGLLVTPNQRWKRKLDPRPLLRDGRRRQPHHQISMRTPG